MESNPLALIFEGIAGLKSAFPLMAIVGIAALVFIVIAAIKSNEGVAYRYPFAIRLIK